MKRMISKIGCIIMALCVFLGAMPICSFAIPDNKVQTVYVDEIEAIQFNPETKVEIPDISTDEFYADKFFSNGEDADTSYLFYNQLTDSQKVLYNETAAAGVVESFVSSLTYYAEGSTSDDAITAVKAQISNDLIAALSAVAEDNPSLFWINGFSYSFSYYPGTNSISVFNLTVIIRIDTNSYTDFADVQTKYNQLVEAVNSAPVNGITRYEKVKSIHDYICSINEYPDQQGTFSDGSPWYGPMAHQPTGVFLKGLAVCEGYSEAFKLLCDREGIPCITVLGEGGGGAHKWNYVKMEDGKWYLVDATWNDQSSLVFNDYLLCGTDTMTPHFESSSPDSDIHIPSGQMYTNTDFVLQYPTLATDSYGMVMLNYNVGDITVEDSMNVIFLGKDITTANYKFVIPSGFTGSLSSSTDLTGGTFTTTKTATGVSKTYMFAKRGDIDGSNSTNITDYNKVVTASTLGDCPTKNTAEYYAGDINHDGAIDGFDAITLDLYLNDTIDFN